MLPCPNGRAAPLHSYAVVTRDLPEAGLRAGDVGVVVRIHARPGSAEPTGYMLETFTVDGESIDTISVPADAVRAAGRGGASK